MITKFENNSYLSALKINNSFNSENKIFNCVKKNNRFRYGNVSYQKFKKHYKSEGWIGRKIIAIPAAVCSGVILTISHLARAILVLVLKGSSSNNFFKTNGYYIARDLQESFGWLVTLLADAYGQYLIQESRFHRKCYDSLLGSPTFTPKKLSENHSDSETTSSQTNVAKSKPKSRPKPKPSSDSISLGGLSKLDKETALLAEKHLKDGLLKKALETAKNMSYPADKTKQEIIAKIATFYLDKKDLDNALITTLELSSISSAEIKKPLLVKIANAYFDKCDLKKTLKTTLKLPSISEVETRNSIVIKIVNSFLDMEDFENALQIIALGNFSLNFEPEKMHSLLIKVAQAAFKQDKTTYILRVFKIIANGLFLLEIFRLKQLDLYKKIIKNSNLSNFVKEFDDKLAQRCYAKTIDLFQQKDANSILNVLIKEITDINTIQAFLKIGNKFSSEGHSGGYSSLSSS